MLQPTGLANQKAWYELTFSCLPSSRCRFEVSAWSHPAVEWCTELMDPSPRTQDEHRRLWWGQVSQKDLRMGVMFYQSLLSSWSSQPSHYYGSRETGIISISLHRRHRRGGHNRTKRWCRGLQQLQKPSISLVNPA